MRRWKRVLGVLLIFLFGVIVGIAGTTAHVARKVRAILAGGSNVVVQEVVKRLDHELKFDPEQKRQVLLIADDARLKLRQSQAAIQPEVERTIVEAEGQVRALLHPDQVEKYDRLLRDRRERWKVRFHGEAGETSTPAPITPVVAPPAVLEPVTTEPEKNQ